MSKKNQKGQAVDQIEFDGTMFRIERVDDHGEMPDSKRMYWSDEADEADQAVAVLKEHREAERGFVEAVIWRWSVYWAVEVRPRVLI